MGEFRINIASGVYQRITAFGLGLGRDIPHGKEKLDVDGNPIAGSNEFVNTDFNELEWSGVPSLTTVAFEFNAKDGSRKRITLIECVCTVTREKRIVTTQLQGRDGDIKEFISNGDYNIQITGGIINQNGDEYPIEEMKQLVQMLDVNESLDVQSDFLRAFKIVSVVTTNYSINQETHTNRQSFSITMLSDKPYEIKIVEDDVAP